MRETCFSVTRGPMGPLAPLVFAAVVEAAGPALSFVIGGVAVIVVLVPMLALRSIRELE